MSGLPNDLSVPANPEEGSGDAWLTKQMQRHDRRRKYTKPADAVELARRMDLQQCRDHSPSFHKLCCDLEARATTANRGAAEDGRQRRYMIDRIPTRVPTHIQRYNRSAWVNIAWLAFLAPFAVLEGALAVSLLMVVVLVIVQLFGAEKMLA